MNLESVLLNLGITVLFGFSTLYLTQAVLLGRRLRKNGPDVVFLLSEKQGRLNGVVCTMTTAVVFILMKAFAMDRHYPLSYESAVHYLSVAVFLTSFILLRTSHNGLKKPHVHRWLTYVCVVSYAVALVTGLIRLWSF